MKAQLTKKERVERTLNGQEIDRPAISAWRHFYNRENNKKDLVSSMIDFQRKFNWDFMKINPRASYHIEDWGAVMQFSVDPLSKPVTVKLPVANRSGWSKLEPLSPGDGVLGEILSASGEIFRQMGDEVYILQTVFSPLSVAADLVGGESRFVELLHESPDELHTALENITETFINFVKELLKIGISGVFFATTELASRNLLTENEYLEFGRSYDLKILRAAAPAMFNVIHVCNRNNMLPLFSDYPVPVVSWNPYEEGNLSIHQATQIFDMVFLTGMNQNSTLLQGSADNIKLQIKDALQDAPPGKLMIGPGCALKAGTPDSNLFAARDTVKEWKYE